MRNERPSPTWLRLSDRPPPPPLNGKPLLCWFRQLPLNCPVLGRYLGNNQVSLITRSRGAQAELSLDSVDAWRPFDEAELERYENA